MSNQTKALAVVKPKVIRLPKPLARFIIDHWSAHQVDELLQKIDTHKGRGTGG